MTATFIDTARHRWPEILGDLAGLSAAVLTNHHQPCPSCRAGEDRFRFDDKDGSGSWFCSHCGGRDQTGGGGLGIDLLMRVTGWSFKEAATKVEAYLGIDSPTSTPRPRKDVRRPVSKAWVGKFHQLPVAPPEIAPLVDGPLVLTSPYRYSDTQRITRVDLGGGRKRFDVMHLDPETDAWHGGAGPDPWPLYNETQVLAACRGLWPVEVEGEKCSGIGLAAGAAFYNHPGHAHKPEQIRERYHRLKAAGAAGIILISDSGDADTTKDGKPKVPEGVRRARVSIDAAYAAGLPILWLEAADIWPELEGIPGASIDDVEGDPVDAILRLQDAAVELHQRIITAPVPEPEPEPERPQTTGTVDHSGVFSLLGYDGPVFYYQPKASGQVAELTVGSHTGTGLCRLAPIRYWERAFPNDQRGVNWTAAASDLFARQHAVGIFDPACLRGRGAWTDGPHSVIHLGDRLLIDGVEGPTDQRPPGSAYHYQSAGRMKGPNGVEPLTAQEGPDLLEIAEKFSWEQNYHGRLLLGWVVLAPICGALSWRPHVWLTAAAGSGKTTVLNGFVTPLLGDMGRAYLGNSTEPGIRQDLKHDAIPVVVDEAEGNTFADQQRINAILTLARNASSDSSGVTVKGGAGEGPSRYRVRSMFLLSSIATGLKQFADQRRFTLLSLVPPNDEAAAVRKAKWQQLEALLEARVTQVVGHRLIARFTGDLPRIKAAIRAFVPIATEFFGSQLKGDQLGTLLAGAWCLTHDGVPTADDINQELALCCWKEQDEDQASVADERDCLATILEHQVMAEGATASHRRTLRDLVSIVVDPASDPLEPVSAREAANVLGRTGLRVEDGALFVSNNAKAIERILRETPWRTSWPAQLRRIPGAARHAPMRFKGTGVHRCTMVPLAALGD